MTTAGDVQGVLFDFGNTLFGHPSLADTIAGAAREMGVPLDAVRAAQLAATIDAAAMHPDELARLRDLDATVWRERWSVLYGLADETAAGLGASVDRAMHAPAAWRPYASTAAVLTALSACGVRVGVVSNTGWDVRAVFTHHGLDALIDHVVLSYEVGLTKPDGAVFLLGADLLGVAPAQVLMVGDDPLADSGAVRVGIRTMLLPLVEPGGENGLDLVAGLVAGSPSRRSSAPPAGAPR